MTEQLDVQTGDIKKVKKKKPFYKKWWVWLIAIIVVISISTSGESEDEKIQASLDRQKESIAKIEAIDKDMEELDKLVEDTEKSSGTDIDGNGKVATETKVEPVVAPVVEEKKEEPAPVKEEPTLTLSQKNAINKAEDYLDYTAFSKSGLIEQLEFEGFPSDEATFAVNNIKVDWKEQAEKKAKDYLDYTSFSRSSLIEQLQFEGFSTEEATYGADKVGI